MVWFRNTLDHSEGRTEKYDTNATKLPSFFSDSACYAIEHPNIKPRLAFTFNTSDLCAAFLAAV